LPPKVEVPLRPVRSWQMPFGFPGDSPQTPFGQQTLCAAGKVAFHLYFTVFLQRFYGSTHAE
jgi:hypothetical protein